MLTVLLLGVGCAKQKEGERCDQNNGDFDCDVGLSCAGEAQISVTGRGFGLCCPTLADPTVDACRARTMFAPEPDAGLSMPVPTPAVDAGNSPVTSTPDAASDGAAANGDGGT